MNAITKHEGGALALQEQDLLDVLRSSLYPGAADASIKMVLGYCKAAGLDPMQKPVHIVPMWDSKTKQMRDVIMPGIGSYRTQAARSGDYAGVTEPEFGPDVSESLDGVHVTYPQWCRVTVKRRMSDGAVAEFTAREFWRENYATKSRDSAAPNAMWAKRPYGQLAKCAEAQALRKAFPEFGSQPTADEMEGKPMTVDAEPSPPPAVPNDLLAEARSAAMEGVAAFRKWWKATPKEQRALLSPALPSLETAAKAADEPTGEIIDVEPTHGD